MQLNLIKKKIQSIQAIKKLTNAMKLITIVKLKKQKNLFFATSKYCQNFYSIFYQIARKDFIDISSKNKLDNSLYIVITSSLGLCGAYNNNICQKITSLLQKNDKVIMFGQKGINYFKANNLEKYLLKTFNFDHNIDSCLSDFVLILSYWCIEQYYLGLFKKIKLVFTKFISLVNIEVNIIDILPFDKKIFKNITLQKQTISFDTTQFTIFKKMLPLYFSCIVYGGLVEGKICELVNRKNKMDISTKNIDDLLDDLKKEFNKNYHENITKQINEIMSTANLKWK